MLIIGKGSDMTFTPYPGGGERGYELRFEDAFSGAFPAWEQMAYRERAGKIFIVDLAVDAEKEYYFMERSNTRRWSSYAVLRHEVREFIDEERKREKMDDIEKKMERASRDGEKWGRYLVAIAPSLPSDMVRSLAFDIAELLGYEDMKAGGSFVASFYDKVTTYREVNQNRLAISPTKSTNFNADVVTGYTVKEP